MITSNSKTAYSSSIALLFIKYVILNKDHIDKLIQESIFKNIVDEFTIGVIGTVTGVLGLAIAVVSYHKQMQLEARFKDKERMLSLAPKIKDLIDTIIDRYLTIYDNPSQEKDDYTYDQLELLGHAIISKTFDEKLDKITVIVETRIAFSAEDNLIDKSRGENMLQENRIDKKKTEHIIINAIDEVDKYLEKDNISYIDISCYIPDRHIKISNNEDTLLYTMLWLYPISKEIDELQDNYGDLIERFSPELLDNLDKSIKSILGTIMMSAVKNNTIEINISDFTKTMGISYSIYNKIINFDEMKHSLNEIDNSINRLEKLRETLLTTGYA